MAKFSYLIFLLPLFSFAESNISNESEFALLQTGGNSVVETYNAKTMTTLEVGKSSYILSGHYTLSKSEKVDEQTNEKDVVESARNWDVMLKYERELSKSFSGYTAFSIEGDKFKGIKQRENLDLGAKYFVAKTKKFNSFVELGARYSVEKTTTRDEDGDDVFRYSKGRLFYQLEHKKVEHMSYKFWIEYLPNFTEHEDYIISYEPSISFVLSDVFSLKTAYKGIYDNQPNEDANEYTDYTFTTSLLAKF
ncbi:MAG: DUF481 domain-containing protein [Bacteriovoracaceae bacterium]|jgi:putative salt-induced outer membrane protein|nr:hypothetical protein [Halobacteriovoraceae bacterium]MDP7321661.1 DUF481 domain-containing protein [Bacteriovoracaceae bacterium]|tara:strand:+ start:343 stop:1092 length:750 start_codon:yes stop_codon:yes gene_type:complete